MCRAPEVPWVRFSSEYSEQGLAVDLYSATQVRARVELFARGDRRVARVDFSADHRYPAMAACFRAAAAVFDGGRERQAHGLRPLDVELCHDDAICGVTRTESRLELVGADAWRALIPAFGEAYAEALP